MWSTEGPWNGLRVTALSLNFLVRAVLGGYALAVGVNVDL